MCFDGNRQYTPKKSINISVPSDVYAEDPNFLNSWMVRKRMWLFIYCVMTLSRFGMEVCGVSIFFILLFKWAVPIGMIYRPFRAGWCM